MGNRAASSSEAVGRGGAEKSTMLIFQRSGWIVKRGDRFEGPSALVYGRHVLPVTAWPCFCERASTHREPTNFVSTAQPSRQVHAPFRHQDAAPGAAAALSELRRARDLRRLRGAPRALSAVRAAAPSGR